jgi:hypothetical protein
VSVPGNAMPDIQSWQDGIGDEGGGKLFILTLRDLSWSAWTVEPKKVTTRA